MKKWLAKIASTPMSGFVAGIVVTAILQSSSAVTVLVCGLVGTRLMTFRQSIGIILGTNIGTAFTGEWLAFKPDGIALPLMVGGAVLWLAKKRILFCFGCILFGVGTVFLSMHGLEKLSVPLAEQKFIHQLLLITQEHLSFGLLSGGLFTALIQSSSATTGIILSFVNQDLLSMAQAAAILLGANVGTCVTALLASIGASREAKQTAFAHLWLNVAGAISFLPFVGPLIALCGMISAAPAVQIAHFGLLFNTVTSLALLPFADRYGALIARWHGGR